MSSLNMSLCVYINISIFERVLPTQVLFGIFEPIQDDCIRWEGEWILKQWFRMKFRIMNKGLFETVFKRLKSDFKKLKVDFGAW